MLLLADKWPAVAVKRTWTVVGRRWSRPTEEVGGRGEGEKEGNESRSEGWLVRKAQCVGHTPLASPLTSPVVNHWRRETSGLATPAFEQPGKTRPGSRVHGPRGWKLVGEGGGGGKEGRV